MSAARGDGLRVHCRDVLNVTPAKVRVLTAMSAARSA